MATLKDIKYADWQIKLNNIGEISEGIDDINQCIAMILTTQKGSVPHRPDFGSDVYKYIDYPVNEAVPDIIRESIDAINKWEKRVSLVSVKASVDESNVKIEVEWKLKESDVGDITEVSL